MPVESCVINTSDGGDVNNREASCNAAGDDDVDDDEDEEEEGPKTEKVKETVWDWDLLNENKALWLRAPGEVDEEDYANFYKALAKVRLIWCL